MLLVAVGGGRKFGGRYLVFTYLDRMLEDNLQICVVHGACGHDRDDAEVPRSFKGADGLAHAWAESRGVKVYTIAARWSALGPKAGPARNSEIIALKPAIVVAFPGGDGTADLCRQAQQARIPVVRARAI